MESVHWGLGSGLGALLGGFAYSSLGPVVLFEASAIMSFLSMLLAMLGFVMYTKEQSYTSDTEPIFNAISAVPLDGDDIDNSSAADDSILDDEEASISFNPFSSKVESRISAVASTVRVDSEGNINSYAAVGFEDSEKGID